MTRPIYITGHKNPDTDSIVSSIAYANYKKEKGVNCIAGRIGPVTSDTEYLLEKFGFEDPQLLFTARSVIKEIDKDTACLVSRDVTMKEATELVTELRNQGVVVVDKDGHLEGVVSIADLTKFYAAEEERLESLLKTATLENIAKTINGEILVKAKKFELSGKVVVFPSLVHTIPEDSIVMVNNEEDCEEYVIENGAKLVIIVSKTIVSEKIKKLARKKDAAIISTSVNPLKVIRVLYQTPTIEHVMVSADKVITCRDTETVEDAASRISKTRFRSYPVLDNEGKVVGAVSRYHLFNYQKKPLILVDHNEIKQSIDDIEAGEVIEIVDHHRIGGIESTGPIEITMMPVGATSTIIAKKYLEEKVPLTKKMAGLLLGGIVADTMNFKSPTTTEIDIDIAKQLEKISGIKAATLFKGIMNAAESILQKKNNEIVYSDYKSFAINGNKVGISQAIVKERKEYDSIRSKLEAFLAECCKAQGYDLMIVLLTAADGSGSYLICAGARSHIIPEIYRDQLKDGFVEGLVSRKKQLLPRVIGALSE